MSWNTALSSADELAQRLRAFEARRGLHGALQADAEPVVAGRQSRPAAAPAQVAAVPPMAPPVTADAQPARIANAAAAVGEAIFVKAAANRRETSDRAADADVLAASERDRIHGNEASPFGDAMTPGFLDTEPLDADVMARRSSRFLIPEDLEDFDAATDDAAPTLDTLFTERRRAPRRQQVIAAYLTAPGMTNIIPARIIDMSATGARVEMTPLGRVGGVPAASLPDRFILVLRHDRIEFDCEIAWQKEWLMGVRFLGMSRPTSDKR